MLVTRDCHFREVSNQIRPLQLQNYVSLKPELLHQRASDFYRLLGIVQSRM